MFGILSVLVKQWLVTCDLQKKPAVRRQPDCFPSVEDTDPLSNQVLGTSYYTRKQFKAFRSLEAYTQMMLGFIASTEGSQTSSLF